ncbi:GLPGLI family protein [Chryseobacterium sp. JJR-5R]|uniref:GLPGLI family protein n=1 Tax=Chryseobacterium sp. JJR-5R TaxID=3093923 RepID=UPI002A748FE2|nr:GLPGLI family protein [Chryseobacterium sp. JJR-5R]WPO82303.1 GLPGLI family protein [Chryseobacterium sp. JJR-5R]
MKQRYFFKVIFLIFANFLNAQNAFRFTYEYSYSPDSTKIENKIKETYFLDFINNKSLFYNIKHKSNDTLFIKDNYVYSDFDYRILKNTSDDVLIEYNNLSEFIYSIEGRTNFQWSINSRLDKILNFNAQQAECHFEGRKWEVWFTTDLPFQDGPYKFNKLPGLIIKASDITGTHIFNLIAIEPLQKELIIFPQKSIIISEVKYRKLLSDYRNNSQKELMNIEITSTEDGLSNEEFKNKMKEYYRRKNKKNNNFINLKN